MKVQQFRKDKAKKILGGTGRWLAWFAGTIGILFCLFALSVCIPKYKIRENLLDSANYLLTSEKLFYQLAEGDRRTEIHNYADATTLNILYSIDGEDSLKEILLSPFYSDRLNTEKSTTELLAERITFERKADTLYDRYWHGMIMILRPLFLIFTIQEIRLLFLGVLLVCMILLTVMLLRRKQKLPAVLLWVAAALVQLPMAAFCIEYFPVVLIMLVISMAMLHWSENRRRILDLCVVSGVCVAFFDFLTTETIAFVIPMALVYCLWDRKGTLKNIKEELVYLAGAGALWAGSYLLTYLTKWGLASLVYGEERFSVALGQFFQRQGNEAVSFAMDSLSNGTISAGAMANAGGNILPQAVSAVMINLRLLLKASGKITLEQLALAVVLAGLLLAAVLYLFRKPGKTGALPLVLCILGFVPVLRMMVLNNHSIEHCFFVYRAFYGTIFCFTAGAIKTVDWAFIRRRKK